MTPEIIRYEISEGKQQAFEIAYTKAAELLKASPHCLGYELMRSEKDSALFLLIIRWDSAEGHLQGFRRSAEFRDFLELVRPYIPLMQEMEHYKTTAITWQR